MKKRILIACAFAGGTLSLAIPFAARATTQAASVPPACFVIAGPNGLTVQAGYAPTGPAGCQQL